MVVPYGEVGVVRSLRSQAVVEVLAIARVVLVHGAHSLDQLGEGREARRVRVKGSQGRRDPRLRYLVRPS